MTIAFYSRGEAKGPNGEILATGQNSVMIDMNSLVWVSKQKIDFSGGPLFSMSATIPIANNSLTSDIRGGIRDAGAVDTLRGLGLQRGAKSCRSQRQDEVALAQ